MAEKSFKKGDQVEWDYAGNKVEGEVVEKMTEDTKIKGHEAKASKDDPQYKVKSEKAGKTAIHKPDELEEESRFAPTKRTQTWLLASSHVARVFVANHEALRASNFIHSGPRERNVALGSKSKRPIG